MELLKSAATVGQVGAANPMDIFFGKLVAQIDMAKAMDNGKTFSSRSLWFRKQGGEWIVRIGRNGFEVAGSKLFKAADLAGVVGVLEAAGDVIRQDKALQGVIAKHSAERSERLKAGRAKSKKAK
ncbi:hypothetical protein EQW76_11200 [Rhizobium sp. rho-13.1]|nr:hypothetical protein EQW76_11200 [Rhizobium sp. rho-13.1]TQY16288.1 hypothetical protein EQW74_10790 [Rhizobium sp. rho-1.1]